MSTPERSALVVGCSLLALAMASEAMAQAWVPARGEGAVSVAFQNIGVTKHLATSTRLDAGRIDTNVVLTDVSFGVTDRMAVDLALPLVSSKYTGSRPHPGTNVDDGTYRSAFTDVRFALRYNLARDGMVITPYVGSIVPSHDYAFYGHAAPGQRLREVQLGVYAAKLLERGLPGLFISGRYGFGFVEEVLDISHNRSIADLEVGYFFSPAFRAFATSHGLYTHGGIDFPAGGLPAVAPALQPVHDQIQRVHALSLGGGVAYSLTDSMDVFASFSREIAGRNGHAMDRGVTLGASWTFRRARRDADPNASAAAATALPTKRERSLVRCICQKSGS